MCAARLLWQGKPCPHVDFSGMPTEHTVCPATQDKNDREEATNFAGTIDVGTPLASQGDLDDATAGGEPMWMSIAKGKLVVNEKSFKAAGGAGANGRLACGK